MTLEDLVPPLELCRKIPAGAFAESALVWGKSSDGEEEYVTRRLDLKIETEFFGKKCTFNLRYQVEKIPAPTLAEIMEALPKFDDDEKVLYCVPDYPKKGKEMIFGEAWSIGYGHDSTTDANPATAALKLWLEVEGASTK